METANEQWKAGVEQSLCFRRSKCANQQSIIQLNIDNIAPMIKASPSTYIMHVNSV